MFVSDTYPASPDVRKSSLFLSCVTSTTDSCQAEDDSSEAEMRMDGDQEDDDPELDTGVDVEAPAVEREVTHVMDTDNSRENDAMSDVEADLPDEEFEEFMPASIYGPPWEDYPFEDSDEEPFDQGIHPPICTLEGEMAKARAQSMSIV
jgi:hypothetical protein